MSRDWRCIIIALCEMISLCMTCNLCPAITITVSDMFPLYCHTTAIGSYSVLMSQVISLVYDHLHYGFVLVCASVNI